MRNRESARASRKRKQDELGRLMDEARQLRGRAADFDSELTHVHAHAQLAKV